MDICIVTADKSLGRFIELELCEAGYTACVSADADAEAKLYIYDLDFYDKGTKENTVGFSYDEGKKNKTEYFLTRPIDILKLRDAVFHRLSVRGETDSHVFAEVNREKRIVKTASGEVRLSERELALLEALYNSKTLSREDGAKLFSCSDSNVVDVYIHYLRKKLAKVCEGNTVTAKRNLGYSLSDTLNIKFT